MTDKSHWPSALVVVIALCLLRGLIGLWNMSALFRYMMRGQYPLFGMFYVYLAETLLFIIFGLWLLWRSPAARWATIFLCGFAIFWSSYGFLSLQFHKTATSTNVAYFVVYLAVDFVTIVFLSHPAIKAAFEVQPAASSSLPPPA